MVFPSMEKPFSAFKSGRIPELQFGAGRLQELPAIASRFGKKILLLTGHSSFKNTDHYIRLKESFRQSGFQLFEESCAGEPDADLINGIINAYKAKKIDCIIAVGGGSAIDAGKSVSAMLTADLPVEAFLEKVGNPNLYSGTKIPFIAVPTTAGTGSEATKNAVISVNKPARIKVSLRHDNLIPDVALIDPLLHLTLPPDVTAACGMDALTQLIEPYMSKNATPMTDALALKGIGLIAENILGVCDIQSLVVDARGAMALGSFFSGICLANAGLGLVHGFAGIIGGQFIIPHGVVCAALLPHVTELAIIRARAENKNHLALKRYAEIGRIISGKQNFQDSDACDMLVHTLYLWKETLKIPGLAAFGMTADSSDTIAAKSDNKNSLIILDLEEKKKILMSAF